jgi:hypothetical protein
VAVAAAVISVTDFLVVGHGIFFSAISKPLRFTRRRTSPSCMRFVMVGHSQGHAEAPLPRISISGNYVQDHHGAAKLSQFFNDVIGQHMWPLFSILWSCAGTQIFVVNEWNCTNFVSYWSLIVVVLSRVGIFSIFLFGLGVINRN